MTKRKRILVLGTSMAGDTPPVVDVALGLLERGHDVVYIGDAMLAEATRGTKLVIAAVPKGLADC
jgi:UDP:flavonoid glycosyltransferase YjiC (YdhE family)